MKQITVFTPTYDRKYILSQLFMSLCEQSCKDFMWLIVDGYGDKNRAHNEGLELCET